MQCTLVYEREPQQPSQNTNIDGWPHRVRQLEVQTLTCSLLVVCLNATCVHWRKFWNKQLQNIIIKTCTPVKQIKTPSCVPQRRWMTTMSRACMQIATPKKTAHTNSCWENPRVNISDCFIYVGSNNTGYKSNKNALTPKNQQRAALRSFTRRCPPERRVNKIVSIRNNKPW